MSGFIRDPDATIPDGPSLEPSGGGQPSVALLVVYRDGIQVIPLQLDNAVTIGRMDPADFRANSRRLSRVHARFLWDGECVTVEDLGSTNGTFVNGRRVRRAVMQADDEVTLGSVVVTLHEIGSLPHGLHGVERHERFLKSVEDEIARSRTFGRGLTMLMIRSFGPRGMLARWVPRVQRLSRVVDRLGLFAPDTVELLAVETDLTEARALAQNILAKREPSEPPLVIGIAEYPQHGSGAEALVSAASEAVAAASLATPVVVWRDDPSSISPEDTDTRVVRNPQMVQLWRMVDRVAASNISVLIRGETGVGKEVIARAIHSSSHRRTSPMRSINCGAIPQTLLESVLFGHERGAFTGADRRRRGVFEEANGGTVLLDEVGELSLAAQVALLRVLETRTITRVGGADEVGIDVHVLAATHQDLEQMCEAGSFRWDLYYRLNTLTLDVPPLRDRRDEIRPMVNQFIDEANRLNNREVNGMTPEALQVLETYHWPGNVRELRNAVERAVVIAVGDYITADDLPQRLRGEFPSDSGDLGPPEDTDSSETGEGNPPVLPLKQAVEALERELIASALAATEGNQSRAAQLLDMSRRTFIYKMQRYEIPDNGGAVGPLLPKFDSEGRRLGFKRRIEVLEKRLLKQALHTAEGDRTQAASLLEIQRRTLDQKLARYNLQADRTP